MYLPNAQNTLGIVLALTLLVTSEPGGDSRAQPARGNADTFAQQRLQNFVNQQRLSRERVRFVPEAHDWSFLAFPKRSVWAKGGSSGAEGFIEKAVIAYEAQPAGMRPCLRVGEYSIQVPASDSCPGDWIAYRADARSTGTSTFRLDWSDAPSVIANIPLRVQQPVDPMRVFAHNDARLGERLYVNNGTSVESFDAAGRVVWKAAALGVGEVIDVTDLDGDGEAEVVFSSGSRLNSLFPAGAGPGELIVLSARDGAVLWRYAFAGVEFGLNRRRTTIVANPDGRSKSIYAVITYSERLWRFDFSGGARKGVLLWKSEPMDYDSPDKAPLVADFDGDGTPEVVVDCMGSLFLMRSTDGVITGRLRYAPSFSFGGFLAAVDLDGDGVPEIVGMSNSIYMKDAFVARYTASGLALMWRRVWEEGLEHTSFEINAERGVVRPAGSRRSYLVWSVRDLRAASKGEVLELVDAVNGATVERIADAKFLDLLRNEDGGYRVAAARHGNGVELITLAAHGFGPRTPVAADRWYGAERLGGPAYIDDTTMAASRALLGVRDEPPTVLLLGKRDRVANQRVASTYELQRGPLYAFQGVAGFIAADRDGNLRRLGARGGDTPWGVYQPRVFGAPIIGDLDSDSRREIVVPYRRGSGVARISAAGKSTIEQIVAEAPGQQRESFYVPLIVHSRSGERLIVSYDAGPRLHLSALNASGKKVWTAPVPEKNWEPSLVVGSNSRGGQTVFYNDSRLTAAFDADDGAALWRHALTGECQRQIASIDWNGDGVADVAVQAGDLIAVFNGATGAPLMSQKAQRSYGGYIAATRSGGSASGSPSIAAYAVGGLTLVGAGDQLTRETQLDDRKVESIPPVIGRIAAGTEGLFQVSGAGRLRSISFAGRLIAERALDARPLSMTGAYIDGDDVVDLLIGTYKGELIAVSGATLRVLWRVQLDGPVGPAVVTDIDGDGAGEVVLITGDGTLVVLALRLSGTGDVRATKT